MFRQFANIGGAMASWTAAWYILTSAFAEQLPADEDMMPLDGNPHPMPGELQPAENFWALPPYPALGWNDVPPPPPDNVQQPPEAQEGWGQQWEDHDDQPAPPEVPPVQDQNSMILNPSLGLDSSSQHVDGAAIGQNALLQHQADGPPAQINVGPHEEVIGPMGEQPAQPLVPFVGPNLPVRQLQDTLHIGMIRVVMGPVLPPIMYWSKTFVSIMPSLFTMHVPRSL